MVLEQLGKLGIDSGEKGKALIKHALHDKNWYTYVQSFGLLVILGGSPIGTSVLRYVCMLCI